MDWWPSKFPAQGITMAEENGAVVTFEESPSDIEKDMLGFDVDLQRSVRKEVAPWVRRYWLSITTV